MLQIDPSFVPIVNRTRLGLRVVKYLILLVIAIKVGRLIFIGTLNYAGYCPDTFRQLTDDEKCRLLAQSVLKRTPEYIYPSNFRRDPNDGHYGYFNFRPQSADEPRYEVIPYLDIDEFFSANPENCLVNEAGFGSNGDPRGFWDRAFGEVTSFVQLKYRIRYRNEHGDSLEREVFTSSGIGVCGKFWSGF